MRSMSRGIPIRWKRAASVGVVRDASRLWVRCGDGEGVSSQFRDPVGQVRAQARPRFSIVASGVDKNGPLSGGSIDLQQGIEVARQVPSVPPQLRINRAGDHLRIEEGYPIGSVDNVELRVVVALGVRQFVVKESAVRSRECGDRKS